MKIIAKVNGQATNEVSLIFSRKIESRCVALIDTHGHEIAPHC